MTRVLFAGGGTGGHLYPAIALSEAIHAEQPDVESHFVGALRGVEARVLPARGLPHTLLPLQPFYRARVWRNMRLFPTALRVARGLEQLFRAYRPALVVGTGGYASGPAGLMAVVRGIPLALQEQNSWPGVTTRMLARWARQIHLGFPEAEKYLKTGRNTRVFAHGNPIEPPDPTRDRTASRAQFGLSGAGVVVLVVGGSQGSLALNATLIAAIEAYCAPASRCAGTRAGDASADVASTSEPDVPHNTAAASDAGVPVPTPPPFEILWATGPAHYDAIRGRLDDAGASWVRAVGYIDDMPAALAAADLAVSRAGAMATAELLAWGIPSLLVPLPTAAADHQTHNARALERAGAAICLKQASLTPEGLWAELTDLVADDARRARMAVAARSRARPDAARRIARDLLTLVAA